MNSVVTTNDSMLSVRIVDIAKNLQDIHKKITAACEKSGRSVDDIRLLLATKTVPTAVLRDVLKMDYRLFGENTAQELVRKESELADQEIEWHFIGQLQSNKVKDILPHCTLIHSLDRLSLAQEIQKRATHPVSVLIEIHSSPEATKAGIAPEELEVFAKQLENMDKIRIQGVMTIAENADEAQKVRQCFKTTKTCFESLKGLHLKNADLKYLSMGMSNDYEMAIEEGANLIRLGSAVFGARAPQK